MITYKLSLLIYLFISAGHRNICLTESAVSSTDGRYRLRSTDTTDYILPRTRTKFGERDFCYSSPAVWNSLPSDLHDLTDTNTFKNGSRVYFLIMRICDVCAALLDVSYSGRVAPGFFLQIFYLY